MESIVALTSFGVRPPKAAMHAASAVDAVSANSARSPSVPHSSSKPPPTKLSPSFSASSPSICSNKHPPNNTSALEIDFTVPFDDTTPDPKESATA
mmetsp:Transcript_21527/g.43678  ORF Transcript_21527/g.43678 Transcript_21527/m.43678 type:complete len:96 (+) Transcript_21527:998-1285(+)